MGEPLSVEDRLKLLEQAVFGRGAEQAPQEGIDQIWKLLNLTAAITPQVRGSFPEGPQPPAQYSHHHLGQPQAAQLVE